MQGSHVKLGYFIVVYSHFANCHELESETTLVRNCYSDDDMDKQSSFNDNVSYSCAMIKIDEKTSWFEMIIWPIEGSLIFERYA